tara:strand:- start:2503 stop:2988 length:486 start_codon:yes stop_codon:yes gene_type:complete
MSQAYQLIAEYYGNKTTKRSGITLINHIDEGRIILDHLNTSDIVKDAYYLHPLLQSDEYFIVNKEMSFDGVNTQSIILTCEYRRVANSYLSFMNKKEFVGLTCLEIKKMLIADKIQNYKDFMLYHYPTHEKSDRLYEYFHDWFEILKINNKELVELIKLIK